MKKILFSCLAFVALLFNNSTSGQTMLKGNTTITISEAKEFTWSLPEVAGKLGYKSITFRKGRYMIEKTESNKYGSVTIPVQSGIKLNPKKDISLMFIRLSKVSLKNASYNGDCVGRGLSCITITRRDGGMDMGVEVEITPVVNKNEITAIKIVFLSQGDINNFSEDVSSVEKNKVAEQANAALKAFPTSQQLEKMSPGTNRLFGRLRKLLDALAILNAPYIGEKAYAANITAMDQLVSIDLQELKIIDMPTERSASLAKTLALSFSRDAEGSTEKERKIKPPSEWCWKCLGEFIDSLFK